MPVFSKLALTASVSLFAGLAVAAPWDPTVKYSTHRVRQVAPSDHVESYHPPNKFVTYTNGVETPLKKRDGPFTTMEASAVSFLEQQLNMGTDGFRVRSTASTDVSGHVWAQQMMNGIPVANAVANVGFNKEQNVVAFGANFHATSTSRAQVAPAEPAIAKEAAISAAEQKLGGKHNGREPSLEYYIQSDGNMALTWVVQVQTSGGDHWYEAFVDASNSNVIATNDFVAGASYNAVDPTVQDVTQGYSTHKDPSDKTSSPNGWHVLGTKTTDDTSGNNAISYKGSESATTKQSSANLVFDYTYDTTQEPTAGQNVDAARVNTFFISNTIHDINYRYGFTEQTFNFQNDNFGKGGQGNDRILISVQDDGGVNNANFATPADGESGQMRMYIWDRSKPNRDGDLSNDIIAHEQTHGTTNRMTGGGTGRCLQTTESGGMASILNIKSSSKLILCQGEGWSDAFAEWLEHKDSSVPDFVLGGWTFNNPAGIRSHPYSTDPKVNPLTYASIKQLDEVHAIGEVWANMLHNVYAELVGQFGWAEDSYVNPDSDKGNVVFLRLFYDALLLQPCNPTMIDARNAWMSADKNRYSGKHTCAVWKAFASRGLGAKAKAGYIEDNSMPAECTNGGGSGDDSSSTPAPVPTTSKPNTSTRTTRTSTVPTQTSCPWWDDC
ncbi:Extracellular metalloproteinase 2; AltName: Full=Elastinolytic metalloproteinase MEP2; AltName: Full=Fungalysin MEP2; Flags: Precursor [Serendipita indica DSM 11827]|nr:Extracellular metalloproteinase 2; AltName: Full=Elastinolytic metalloproteinase MEP2; AltName: Full=Fungalysin MEP2; Flags: Precursor [Serendipita indica DSM 11827]